jgi:hypothetical protein
VRLALDYDSQKPGKRFAFPYYHLLFLLFMEIEYFPKKKRLQQPLPIATGAFSSLSTYYSFNALPQAIGRVKMKKLKNEIINTSLMRMFLLFITRLRLLIWITEISLKYNMQENYQIS